MTHSDVRIITCPVCGSGGAALRHDIRSSLLYSCDTCQHEWQIEPGEVPLQTVPPRSGQPPPGVAHRKPSPSS